MPPFICILGTPAPPCVSLLLARQWPGASGAGPGVRLWLRARAHAGLCVRLAARTPSPAAGTQPPAACPASLLLAATYSQRPHPALAASSPGTRSVLTRHSQPAARPAQPSPARLPLPPLKVSLEPTPSRRATRGDGFLKLCSSYSTLRRVPT